MSWAWAVLVLLAFVVGAILGVTVLVYQFIKAFNE